MKLSTTSLALLILLAASRTYHQKQKKSSTMDKNGGKKPLYTKYIQGVSRIVTKMGSETLRVLFQNLII
jgi:hypothetical protein